MAGVNSFTVGGFFAFVGRRLVTAVYLNIGVMRDATFFPVPPHYLAEKRVWIFAPNVATRADIAPSRQHFFHFHLRILIIRRTMADTCGWPFFGFFLKNPDDPIAGLHQVNERKIIAGVNWNALRQWVDAPQRAVLFQQLNRKSLFQEVPQSGRSREMHTGSTSYSLKN
jgi:hypothetical protein